MNSPTKLAAVLAIALVSLASRTAGAQEPDAPQCAPDWKKKVLLDARDSVVSIETVGFSIDHFEPIAGFVYPTRSHVVAITSAAGIGRGVKVRFANGKEIKAEPVSFDEARHVTILKLDEEAPAPPLRLSDRPLEVGTEIVSVSPIEGPAVVDPDSMVLDAQLHVGHVATVGDRTLLRFDAAWPATVGSPLFDCSAQVVGLRGWGAILAAKDIRPVTPQETPVDVRRWSALHMHLGVLGQGGDGSARIGASSGLSLVYGDRWQIRLAFGALGNIPRPSEKDRTDERVTNARLQLESTVGYRILLTEKFPTYLVPQIGVVGRVDLTTRTRTEVTVNDVGCLARGGPCKVESTSGSSTTASGSIAPVLGAAFMIPGAAVGYQLHLDVQDPSRSTHQVYLGFEF